MDALKERLPVIGIGLAALAVAGYIVFGLDKGNKKKPSQASQPQQPSVELKMEKVGPEFHFIPADLPDSTKMQLVQEWLKKQIASLLMDGPVKAKGCVLSNKNDFLWLCAIIENVAKTLSHKDRESLQTERLALLQAKGFNSVEYLEMIIDHVTQLKEEADISKDEVLEQAKISDLVFKGSVEEYIGNDDNIDEFYVRRNLEVFFFHPIKGDDHEAKVQDLVSIFKKTLDRFGQEDIYSLAFPTPDFFLLCFDLACMDLAQTDLHMTEATYRSAVNNDETFFDLPEIKQLCRGLCEQIFALLAHAENEFIRQQEEEKKQDLKRDAMPQVALGESLYTQQDQQKQLQPQVIQDQVDSDEVKDAMPHMPMGQSVEIPETKPVEEPVKPVKVEEPVKVEPIKAAVIEEPVKIEPVPAKAPVQVAEVVEPAQVEAPAESVEAEAPVAKDAMPHVPIGKSVEIPETKPESVEVKPVKVEEPVQVAAPIKVEEPVKVAAPVKVEEPVKVAAPIKVEEPVKVAAPVKVEEPVKIEQPIVKEVAQPIKIEEPLKVIEQTKVEEPAKIVAKAEAPLAEPVKASEAVKVQEPSQIEEPLLEEPEQAKEEETKDEVFLDAVEDAQSTAVTETSEVVEESPTAQTAAQEAASLMQGSKKKSRKQKK